MYYDKISEQEIEQLADSHGIEYDIALAIAEIAANKTEWERIFEDPSPAEQTAVLKYGGEIV